jgi:hypothetical protein
VPAESHSIRSAKPSALTKWRITASPAGERQMFPIQTNNNLYGRMAGSLPACFAKGNPSLAELEQGKPSG